MKPGRICRKVIRKRLSQIQSDIKNEYESSQVVERLTNRNKQNEWINSNFDRFGSPQSQSLKTFDNVNPYTSKQTQRRKKTLKYRRGITQHKVRFEEYKQHKSFKRNAQTKMEIVNNKMKLKVTADSKDPFYIYRSFGRKQKSYDTEIKIKMRRPKTSSQSRNLDFGKWRS